MDCEAFEARIHWLLDRRAALTADHRLRTHARNCPRCADVLAAHLRLAEGLERFAVPALDDGFSRRVVELATADRPETLGRQRRSWRQPLPMAAAGLLAATLLIALFVRQSAREIPGPPASRPVAAIPPQPASLPEAAAEPTGHPPTELMALAAATDEDWQGLWGRLADQLAAERSQSLIPLAEGIRPIAASLGSVWDELRRAFLLGGEPSAAEHLEDSAAGPSEPGRLIVS